MQHKDIDGLALLNQQITYKTIVGLFMMAFILTDKDGTILEVNQAACNLFGYNEDELKAIGRQGLISHTGKLMEEQLEEKRTTGNVKEELIGIKKNGGRFPLELSSMIFNGANGEEINCITLNDITERKKAEDEIIQLNSLYAFTSHVNKMIVRITDQATLFKETCRMAVDLGQFCMAWIGLMDEEAKTVVPVSHAGRSADYLAQIKPISMVALPEGWDPTVTALKEGKYIFCNNIENNPDMAPWKGIAMDYLSSIALPIKKSGKVIGSFSLYAPTGNFFNKERIDLLEATTNDISFALEIFEKEKMRKLAEEKLLKSERRYQTLAEISPVGIFHTDETGYTTYVNPSWCKISGISYEEALGNGWFNAVHKDDRETLTRGWREATETKRTSISEYRFVRSDGSIAWVLGQAIPEKNSKNEIVGYVGTTTDITERKKAEEEVAKAYSDKETLLNRINDGMVSLDNEWRYTFLNDAALSTHPLSREGTLGKVIWDVHPEMKGTIFWDKYHEAMEEEKVVEIESYYAPMNIWFFVKVYPSNNGLTIFYRDITEQKKAEETIKENEKKIELIYNTTKDALYLISVKGTKFRFDSVNQSFLTATGLMKDQVVGKFVDEIIPEPSLSLVLHNYQSSIANKQTVQWEETSAYPSGTKTGIVSITPVYDEQGNCNMLVGTVHDITDIKEIENDIRKEKQLSDSIINSLPGVFYLYNKKGEFLRWNNNFEQVTMYHADEIKQMHPLDFFDSNNKELLAEKIANTFLNGEDNVQAGFLLKSKETIPYYFTGKAIEYEGSTCLLGVGIDFSERIKAQEEIKETSEKLSQLTNHLQTVLEEERKRISREIHDDLGQQLTAINMDVAWIDKKIPEDDHLIKTKLKNIRQLLNSSNLSIRRILSELRPIILENYGLKDAVLWLCKQFTAATGTEVIINGTITDIKTSEQIANCIFRAYQEAFTNITRYAGAQKVTTSISIANNAINVLIEDDGIGFNTASTGRGKSFGILGMKERIHSLGGNFNLVSSLGKGTRISIQLPIAVPLNFQQ